MLLPLILIVGISANFYSTYIQAFYLFHEQYIGYDVRVSINTRQTRFTYINQSLNEQLEGFPYKGCVASTYYGFSRYSDFANISVFSPNKERYDYINQTLSLRGYNFSSPNFRNYFLNKSIILTSGRFPTNENESIVDIRLERFYNVSLNSKINIQSSNITNLNATIVGFFENVGSSPRDYKYYVSGDFVFF